RTMQPITRIVLGGMQEILGTADVTAVLAAADIEYRLPANGDYVLQAGLDFVELCRLQIGLEKLYGDTTGQGVILRCGRAGFKHLLQDFGEGIGLTDREYRFMPSKRRLTAGLRAVGGFFADGSGGSVLVREAPDAWVWESNACPWCWQRARKGCACFFMVGLLGEYFSWASGGKVYPLAETECMAAGASACVIRIDKWALD
ncbi:MAG: 4-vinyl reductase, partial [Anaerolineaceae bacterium]|nr:4-vinyl reductase [Anaerolineaceae bacterium]